MSEQSHPNPIAFTIMSGNPVEGFSLYGQFESNHAACTAGNNEPHFEHEWWVVPIYKLNEDEVKVAPIGELTRHVANPVKAAALKWP